MSPQPSPRVVIIGAGQAAAQLISSLCRADFPGRITLIGAEPFPPYQRPPLSKAYMKGELPEDRLFMRPAAWYADHGVDLILSMRATSIDRDARRVHIEHGGRVDYDILVIASGSRPRKLAVPGADLERVYTLRDLEDVERIAPQLIDGRSMVVVGAGYIGLEVAASARQMGLNVTVLEYAPRILARVTSPLISEFFTHEHGRQGVTIQTDARLARLDGAGDRVCAAVLDDGNRIAADLALIGIGILPNDELARDAGIDCDDGIVVDRDARSSDPNVFAIGDCARRPLVHYGRSGRLESVHNAIEQGKLAAAAILGQPRPTEDCPWFWSDQFDLKLQIAGLSQGYDDIVLRGDPADRKFAAFYLKGQKLIATDAINSPLEFMLSKKLIISAATLDQKTLADTSVGMKDIVAQAIG